MKKYEKNACNFFRLWYLISRSNDAGVAQG